MPKGLKIVHLNIRSLLPKIDQIRLLLYNSKIDIITLSKTWLNPMLDSALIAIPGYKHFRLDRKTDNPKKKGGGLITYIRNDLASGVQVLGNLETLNADLKAQWIEIERDRARNILICNIYRPPTGNVKAALTTLNNKLSQVRWSRKDLFILGDFNIDYKNKTAPAYKKLLFFEKVNNLTQHIENATRVTKHSSTLLYLILSNAQYITRSRTLDTYISDQSPIYIIKKKHKIPKVTETFRGRQYGKYNPNQLKDRLLGSDWTDF